MWTLEGAEEVLGRFYIIDSLDSHTIERRDMRTFACWAWVWIPTDIPTRHCLLCFEDDAGCVDSRMVSEPPEGERSSLLFHLDRIKDWTPREQRSPASGVSGLPSSGLDNDECRPLHEVNSLD
ncbi:hypothetical protein VPH35_065072 [Triticum aestivum]